MDFPLFGASLSITYLIKFRTKENDYGINQQIWDSWRVNSIPVDEKTMVDDSDGDCFGIIWAFIGLCTGIGIGTIHLHTFLEATL